MELTSFVGRRQALADLKRTLPSTRLLTLTGPGGVGKTKLALRAAREGARLYADGAWFVELAPVVDPAMVVQAVFTALGLQDHSSRWAVATLGEYLADQRPLLLLDNCEHVRDAAAALAGALLRACPGLRILATSRQALGVTGEVVIDVPGLSLPDAEDTSVAAMLSSDAVALFVERAGAVQQGFAVDQGNADHILRICSHLDGVPLALELAAVRVRAMGLEALERALSNRLAAALGTGDSSAAPRHHTLEATIDWSYQLLGTEERLLWARLSVFSGGFQLDAARAVCSGDGLSGESIPELVAKLVEKSVLKRGQTHGSERFRLLEPLRQFGLERLRETGEEGNLRARHRDWVAVLAAATGAHDERQVELFHRIRTERANVWSAIDFCLAEPDEAPAGLAMCADLWTYWASQGPTTDLRRVFQALLEAVSAPTRPRAMGLNCAGVFAFQQNDYAAAAGMFAEALAIGRQLRDPELVALSLGFHSSVAWVEGRSKDGAALADESLSIARTMRLPYATLRALNIRGYAFLAQGNLDAAIAIAGEGVRLSEELGESWDRGILYQLLAGALLRRGDHDQAATNAQHALLLERSLDDRTGLGHTMAVLASIEMARGSAGRAATLLGASEAVLRSVPSSLLEPFRDAHQRTIAAAGDALGPGRYEAAFSLGLNMTRDEAVDFAVDRPRPVARASLNAAADGPLSKRETEVARLVAGGSTNAQVAGSLFISERTVESHIASIFNKLGIDNRLQLARWILAADAIVPS